MTSQELSNMIFNIKDKISDKEFKDIMEKLSIKHEEDKNDDTFELRYIKKTTHLGVTSDRDIAWRLCEKIKVKKVKIKCEGLLYIVNKLILEQNGFFNDEDVKLNFSIYEKDNIRYFEKSCPCFWEWLENFNKKDDEDDEDDDNGIFLTYKQITPIHIKKEST